MKGKIFHVSNTSSIIGLSIVPVKVKAKGQERNVFNIRILGLRFQHFILYQRPPQKASCQGRENYPFANYNANVKPIECSLVNLEVTDLNDHNLIELPMVYSRPSLPVSTDTIATLEDVNQWPHLKGISIPSIDAEIGLLIGRTRQKYCSQEKSGKEKMVVPSQHTPFSDGC